MHNMGKTVNELHAMLKLHEETLPKKVAAPALHAIRAGKVQKNKNKKLSKATKGVHGKDKGKKAYANAEPSYAPKPKNPLPPKKDNPDKDAICHHCSEVGIFTIELYSFPRTSWVYDTGCGTHICNITQGLRGSKKLNPGALSLYLGNGQHAAIEAIGNYHLCLPSVLVIVLNNFHYAPSITRGIISISRLYEDGFINRFELNNAISVSKNNVVYFSAIPRDGVYEIEMSCSNTNDSSIKKRIEKLQHDGLLNSTDIESLGKCVSCMSGKMARKPYSHQVERAKDLLGLIHTDVCGLFRIVSRQGANYFVTFTDDFSRYGYVYLLKHKHEVFETFKVFQKEVENQLEKTIKSLRSDRGDMVRSMMSQTILPKSFWDYAIESAARILNMVPTKKVDKTPCEIWHGNLIDQEASGSLKDLKIIQEEDTNPSLDTSLNHEEDDQEINEPQRDINPIPALLDLEYEKWLADMNVEMKSMKDNDVWELVELPPNAKIVGHKWLFKKKTDMDGVVHTFKSRLVAKGFTQTYGVVYEETFSPVADIRAIRILIAIDVLYDYEIWQVDVKTTFLNGHLSKEVYMTQPKGFINPKYPNHVCKLKRSIYGLKQASRQWNKRFDDEIKKLGFIQNRDEPCVYQKASGSYVTFLILYVDDILIMGNNIPMLQDVKSYLGKCFATKDLGEAAYILGIKIYRYRL
ncbi:retrotransposon protein, putative, ty1-copia subclass [Tanacetum coccineum]